MTGDRTVKAWVMTEPGKPCQEQAIPCPAPPAGEALIEVAGCGVCHTDISFLFLGVPTRAKPPLALGHEISGKVVEVGPGGDSALVGKPVLIPAVLPCGECDLCRAGHRRICRAQVMPGNDRHGGFSSHITVPARYLCPVGDEVLAGHELWEISIVADAITTPYQAAKLSGLSPGDLAICIGVGGIGIHGVQVAAAMGAKVIALDIDPQKLEVAAEHGADAVIDVTDLSVKEVKGRVKEEAKRIGAPKYLWKIFETSGSKPGQELGVALMGFGSHLSVVGFTLAKLEMRPSNLMAFDASMTGNWGCDPELYPELLDWIAAGKIKVRPFVQKFPLAEINKVLDQAHAGKLSRRAVLVP
jgi:6-hydroxycyclohex-1-ene-1-carbonyl-CoA dehydrogenase